MASYRELLAAREKLEAEIARARNEEAGSILEQIRAQVADYGFTVEDIFGSKRKGSQHNWTRVPVAPKYRDPQTGATWSGRGRAPLWIAGKDRAKFAI
ncbi:DNA-binding protein H-NS [Paraburkholderia sp. GAS448]|uniref:H-NS histone family protein n=1 Tax=Paraburkholderia sp. GAS448 TaxID=3035136 RepID=UPI003D1DA1CD